MICFVIVEIQKENYHPLNCSVYKGLRMICFVIEKIQKRDHPLNGSVYKEGYV